MIIIIAGLTGLLTGLWLAWMYLLGEDDRQQDRISRRERRREYK